MIAENMEINDFKNQRFNHTFEQVQAKIIWRQQTDPNFTIEVLEGLLEGLYIYEGNDWVGRGELGSIDLNATIAAHEHVLAEWRNKGNGDVI